MVFDCRGRRNTRLSGKKFQALIELGKMSFEIEKTLLGEELMSGCERIYTCINWLYTPQDYTATIPATNSNLLVNISIIVWGPDNFVLLVN